MLETKIILPVKVIRDIFLMLPIDSIKNSRIVCKSWNKFIVQYIWRTKYGKTRMMQKLNSNWDVQQPKYIKTDKLRSLSKIQKPYVLLATEKFLVMIEYKLLNETEQFLWIFQHNENNYWRSENFGPVRKVNVLQENNFIPIETHINNKIFCILYQNSENSRFKQTMKIWSTKSKKLLFEKSFIAYGLCYFLSTVSTLINVESTKIESLQFTSRKLKAIKSQHHELTALEDNIEGYNNSNQFILLWQKSMNYKNEIEMFIWKIHKSRPKLSFKFSKFRELAKLSMENYIENQQYQEIEILIDAMCVKSNIILLTQIKIIDDMMLESYNFQNQFQRTFIKILQIDSKTVRKILLTESLQTPSSFTNGSILFNQNRLLLKLFGSSNKELLIMFNLSNVLNISEEINYKILEEFEENDESYKYDSYFPTRFSLKHGYFVTTNFITRAIIVGENKLHVMIKKCIFG